MKFLVFLIFILLNFTKFAYSNNVVYIDMSYILSNSNQGKFILNELEDKNKANIKELESKETILRDLEQNIKNQKNILSKNEIEKKINDLKKKIIIFNKDKDKLSRDFNEYKNSQIKDFMKKIKPLVSDYIKKNSINIVLDKKNVIIGKKDQDITFKILEIVNKNIN